MNYPQYPSYLRLCNVSFSEYFKKKGVCTLTVKELFDFVTDVNITADNLDDNIDRLMTLASNRTIEDLTAQEKIDEEVKYKS